MTGVLGTFGLLTLLGKNTGQQPKSRDVNKLRRACMLQGPLLVLVALIRREVGFVPTSLVERGLKGPAQSALEPRRASVARFVLGQIVSVIKELIRRL